MFPPPLQLDELFCDVLVLSLSFFVNMYKVFMPFFSAAFSATSARCSTCCHLSRLAAVFTSLSFSMYWAEILSFNLGDLVSGSFFLICFPPLWLSCVSVDIHSDFTLFWYAMVSFASWFKLSMVSTASS